MPRFSAQPAALPGTFRFSVLGPLAVHRDDRELPLGPLKQRVVLATLLGSANSPVSVDALTDAVYRRSPYNRRPSRSTRNATDSIFRNGGSRSMLRVARSGSGYMAGITMGVSR